MMEWLSTSQAEIDRRAPFLLKSIFGSANEFSTEILRLLMLYPYVEDYLTALHVRQESWAARLVNEMIQDWLRRSAGG